MKHVCASMQSTLDEAGNLFEQKFQISERAQTTSAAKTIDPPLVPPSFEISFENLKLQVEGSNVTHVSGELNEELFLKLARGAAKGVGVWYNVTGKVSCYGWKARQTADEQSED